MAEKISIVTISFNSRLAIEKTIQSILLQNYRPLEYILVDGGSNDGTIDIIMKYIPKLERAGIEVNFKSEPDEGIYLSLRLWITYIFTSERARSPRHGIPLQSRISCAARGWFRRTGSHRRIRFSAFRRCA